MDLQIVLSSVKYLELWTDKLPPLALHSTHLIRLELYSSCLKMVTENLTDIVNHNWRFKGVGGKAINFDSENDISALRHLVMHNS